MEYFYEDFHEAYTDILERVLLRPQYTASPRGRRTHEIVNYSFVIEDSQNYIDWERTGMPERQRVVDAYWQRELAWYLSGETHESKGFPAQFWHTLKDDNGHVTSNYGKLAILDKKYIDKDGTARGGFDNVVDILKKDPDSRQAVIHYGEPQYFWRGNKDTPCCATNQFFLRDGELKMTVYMRSNDVIKGLTYDYRWFAYLQSRISEELGVTPGDISYFAGSMHLYAEDFEVAKKILKLDHP